MIASLKNMTTVLRGCFSIRGCKFLVGVLCLKANSLEEMCSVVVGPEKIDWNGCKLRCGSPTMSSLLQQDFLQNLKDRRQEY